MNKLKVVISGLLYPMTMLHWFWKAFERREDIELYVLGPFFDDWIPWNGGMTLPKKYVKYPQLPLPKNAQKLHAQFIENMLPDEWKNPDLWLQIDAGWHLLNKPLAKTVAHIQTDPHVLKNHYQLPKSYSDINFCMQSAYILPDEKYLPYAFDPTIHYPEEVEKEYDACLVGLHYDHRTLLINQMISDGLKVYYSIGELYGDYRRSYCKSKLAVSWSSMKDTPARVFEAFGMGLPLICNRTPDLSNFFVENDHYLGFDTVTEARNRILWAMANYDEVKEIGDAGRRKALAGHTWDHRISQILDDCGLKKS